MWERVDLGCLRWTKKLANLIHAKLEQKQNEQKHAKLIHENETVARNHESDEIKREKTEYNTYN
jgi:hypothetical protein